MTDVDTTARMARAEAARSVLAGNAAAFDAIREQLTANLIAAAKQGRHDRATDLIGMQLKAIDNLEAYFTAIVADGDVARHAAETTADLTRMSVEQQRYAKY